MAEPRGLMGRFFRSPLVLIKSLNAYDNLYVALTGTMATRK